MLLAASVRAAPLTLRHDGLGYAHRRRGHEAWRQERPPRLPLHEHDVVCHVSLPICVSITDPLVLSLTGMKSATAQKHVRMTSDTGRAGRSLQAGFVSGAVVHAPVKRTRPALP